MIYLIGGCARSGKTRLTKTLIRRRPMPAIPTDAMMVALRQGAPELGIDIAKPLLSQSRAFQRFFFPLVSNLSYAWERACIEGAVILPRHVARLERRGLAVSCCFLGWSEIEEETVIRYEGHNPWFSLSDPKQQKQSIKSMMSHSRALERECDRYGVPYVDMAAGPYSEQQQLALDLLLKQER